MPCGRHLGSAPCLLAALHCQVAAQPHVPRPVVGRPATALGLSCPTVRVQIPYHPLSNIQTFKKGSKVVKGLYTYYIGGSKGKLASEWKTVMSAWSNNQKTISKYTLDRVKDFSSKVSGWGACVPARLVACAGRTLASMASSSRAWLARRAPGFAARSHLLRAPI